MSEKLDSLPTAIQKRDFLFGVKKADSSEWKNWGSKFLAEDWIYDSIDFLTRANDQTALMNIRERVREEGNVFLLLKVLRSLGVTELGPADLNAVRACAEVAESMGKHRYAIKGFERAGDTERVEKIRALIAHDGDIVAEASTEVFIPPMNEEADAEDSE